MSPIRPGRGAGATVSVLALRRASSALDSALTSGGAELPARGVEASEAIVTKVAERMALVGGHTVVALAGATGSGKSSIFNALIGTDVATVGARRPTTSSPTAAVWGPEPAGPLLDWLQVGRRHQVPAQDRDPLDGLVLLDLPDFDSRELGNRAEAERILALVDLFVWVTDPQKYADARLHEDYVSALAAHEAVTMVVLNQVDRLTPSETEQCVEDLRRLLAEDGLQRGTVLATSALTGQGLDELHQRLVNAVTGRSAARTRLAADVRVAASGLRRHVADTEPELRAQDHGELMDALARTAGVPTVVDAVDRDYRLEALSFTGWPFTRWVQGLRAKPLRRLRLDGKDITFSEQEVRNVLGRSSIPPPSPAAKAAVALATRRVVSTAGNGLPPPWAEALEKAASPPDENLTDALDRAVVSTPLRARNPLWWRIVGYLQILLALAAVAGVIWYVGIWLLQWFQVPQSTPPLVADRIPVPLIFLVGGLVLGVVVAALARVASRVGARRRAAGIERRLRKAIAAVADAEILQPVSAVLQRHRATREALDTAQRF